MIALLTLLLSVFSVAAHAASVPVVIEDIWVDDDLVTGNDVRADLKRGGSFEVKVKVRALQDADNVRLEVQMSGDDRHDIDERSEAFKVEAGKVYFPSVTLELPDNLDIKPDSEYVVEVEVTGKGKSPVEREFTLDVATARHGVGIEDVLFSPGLTVEAGRSLLAEVRVENNGEKDEEDVKVTLELEGIGLDADYLDELDNDEEKSTRQLYVRVPVCTPEGRYTATVTVDYDENTRSASKEYAVNVLGSELCAGSASAEQKTVITVGPESQNVVAGGSEAVYPIALTNAGRESRTYSIQLTTGDWAATRLSSNVLTVGAGETKVAYANVAAKADAAAGEKLLSIVVKSGDETLKEVTLKANVVKTTGSTTNGRQALQVGLVVLVVLLVIIGLIVGFSRLKGNEKEDETYY